VADQAAYLDRSEIDAVEPLTATAFDEGELPAGALAEPLDAAELSDIENMDRWADIAEGLQPASIDAELAENSSVVL
jgi:hypothetical protein